MKTFLLLLSFATALVLSNAAAPVYRCPMHPWIKSGKLGDKCTICGMALVAVPNTDVDAVADPNLVKLAPAAASVIGLETAEVRRTTLRRSLKVVGVIEDDDTRHRILAARVPGRIEKLFVNYVGADVRAGEPLATVYSPEMLTAQRQYVERLRAGENAFTVSERAASREHLLELGLTEDEVDILEHTRAATPMITIRSPISGTVVARHVYEGQELNKDQSEQGTRLFEIADFSSMWFVFDAYEPDLAWLRVGQLVEVTSAAFDGPARLAPIAFIDPNLNELTRTAKVRVVLANQDRRLFHRQTASGRVRLEMPDVLVVPRSAVLQHSGEPVVFVEQADRVYLARRVSLGRSGDTAVEVVTGLNAGEKVVTQGALLLDGQAQLSRAPVTGEVRSDQNPAGAAVPEPTDAIREGIAPLAFAAADSAAALSADDLAGYQRQLPILRAALQACLATGRASPLEKFAGTLRDRADLRSARRDFEPLSTAVADLVRAAGLQHEGGLHVFQCPMAPVLGVGRWISRTPELKNPFFGAAMLTCGEELN